jgi:3-hydroxyisobutyrate dehydrogenase-like beta-hydroxyacid dehydrogenase
MSATSGAGQVAKACNQMVMVGAIQAVAEALHFGRAAGADPARVRQALAGGSAGSRVLEVMGARMVASETLPPASKPVCTTRITPSVLAEAHRLGVPLPVSTARSGGQLNALDGDGLGAHLTRQRAVACSGIWQTKRRMRRRLAIVSIAILLSCLRGVSAAWRRSLKSAWPA